MPGDVAHRKRAYHTQVLHEAAIRVDTEHVGDGQGRVDWTTQGTVGEFLVADLIPDMASER